MWGKDEVPDDDAGGGCSRADCEEGSGGLDEGFSGLGIGVSAGIGGPSFGLGDESSEPFDGVGLLEGVGA